MDLTSKQQEFEQLKARVKELELELESEESAIRRWQPSGYYGTYYATSGVILGAVAAVTALMTNVICAPIVGKHPLQLIRIFLTFPLGEQALALTESSSPVVNDGLILTFGCCLYMATGMLIGMPLYMLLVKFCGKSGFAKRLLMASGLGLAIWLVNFYGILIWLQPILFKGNWITDNQILPWWVAAGTHLVYAWTMAILYPLGLYLPIPRPMEEK